jgi:hypothetical protein
MRKKAKNSVKARQGTLSAAIGIQRMKEKTIPCNISFSFRSIKLAARSSKEKSQRAA